MFPENYVEILHDYSLPFRTTVATALSQVVSLDPIPESVTKFPENQPAIDVIRARQRLLRFLQHPSIDDLQNKLSGQDGVYKRMATRQFQLVPDAINGINPQTEPALRLFPGTLVATALRRDNIDYKEEETEIDGGGHPHKVVVTETLPGYNGPPLDQSEMNQLRELNEFITGGPEFQFRIGLLSAECQFGLHQYEQAIGTYTTLLTNASTLPLSDERRKFLAIRCGFALLAQGDSLFRRSRVLTDDQRSQVLATYNSAIQRLQDNTVPPDNPVSQQIVAYAQTQISKINGGFNVFGYHENYVPVLRPETLHNLASARLDLAKEAATAFEAFLTKATQLNMLADQYDNEMKVAEKSIEKAQEQVAVALDQIDKADETINEITDQINALQTSTIQGVFETLMKTAAAATAAYFTAGAGTAAVATALGSGSGLISTATDYESRSAELEHQKRIAELEQDIAGHEQSIALLDQDIATLNRDFAQKQEEIVRAGRLNPDLYYALANVFEDFTIRHMTLATQWAYLYERAVAFRRLIELQIIKLDYLDAGQQDLTKAILSAAQALEDDLTTVNEQDVPITKGQLLEEVISLKQQYPIQFNQLSQTGHMDFVLSLYDLDKRRPGVYQERIESVNVQVVGLIPPTGFTGHIIHHGPFLLRDKDSTLSAQRFIPTDAELAQALKEIQAGGAQGHAVAGVIPIVVDLDRKELSQETETNSSGDSREFTLDLMEDYGPAAVWSLVLENIDPRLITDVLLKLTLRIPEASDQLEQRVRALLKSYEQELAAGDALDRIAVIFMRQQQPDALAQLKGTGVASFQVLDRDLPVGLTEVKVKTIISQVIDKDEKGVAGIALEITQSGTTFSIARTTREDGYSEDLSSPPPFVAPADRVPMLGTWQIRLTNPAQSSTFDNMLLFFIYEFKEL